MKNDVEKAIVNLKCYIETYASRASKPAQRETADALEKSLNAIIDYYNENEKIQERLFSAEKSRELYLYLILNGAGDYYIEKAKDMPARFVYNYIVNSENISKPINERVRGAVNAWRALREAKTSVDELHELLHAADAHVKEPSQRERFKKSVLHDIEEYNKLINELTY